MIKAKHIPIIIAIITIVLQSQRYCRGFAWVIPKSCYFDAKGSFLLVASLCKSVPSGRANNAPLRSDMNTSWQNPVDELFQSWENLLSSEY